MRFVGFVFAIVAGFTPIAFATDHMSQPKTKEWAVTALSEQTFLLEKTKIAVLVDVDYASDEEATVAKFIRSSDYVKAMKLLRNQDSLGLEGEDVTASATRKQYGTTYVGVTESLFKLGDRSAVLTEYWWVKSHFTFHVVILSRGIFAQSIEEQEKIF